MADYNSSYTGQQIDNAVGAGLAVRDANGLIKSNGSGGVSAAVLGVDYAPAVTATASGPLASFAPAAPGYPVTRLIVNIEPVQSGTGDPSSNNIRPISGWTGCSVHVDNRNLCLTPTIGCSYDINSGASVASNTAAVTDKIHIDFSGGYITLSHAANIRCMLYAWDKDRNFVGRTAGKTPASSGRTVFTVTPVSFSSGSGTKNYSSIAFVAVRFYESAGESDPIATAMASANAQLEIGNTSTEYIQNNNAVTSSSWQSTAGTVYGGYINVITGELVVEWANIASYSGQPLPGEWISDRDVYANNTTPTTGAQVVYKTASPSTYQLSATQILTLSSGKTNIWSDVGNVAVTYSAYVKDYVDSVVLGAIGGSY